MGEQRTRADSPPAIPPDAEIYDLTILGAGPTGLFAAFYAGFREMRTKIIEALPELGGQITVLYPEKYIYDVAGIPKILAKELVKSLTEQGLRFRPQVHLGERALSLRPVADKLLEVRTDRDLHYTRTVLIAAGIGAFSPNRLGAPGVEEFEGRGVYYHVQDLRAFRDKRLLIVGGGDSAVDWALNLKDIAQHVTLIHRREGFRAHEGSVAQLRASPVQVKIFYELKRVHGNEGVEGVTIFDNRDGHEEELKVDAVLINIGYKADLGPIKEWGLELDRRYVKVNGRMETNLPGVYAAGDIASPVGGVNLNLIAIGFAQAAIAVNVAKTYIEPQAPVFPGHSSEKM